MRRRKLWLAVAAVIVVAAAIVVVWFQPQKLFIDKKVNEASPVAAATVPAGESPPAPLPTAAAAPTVLGSGAFVSGEHSTTGRALVIHAPDGSRTLRLEDLKTSNGP